MNSVISIVVFILSVSFLAFIHELGHYLAARFFNIEIEEFGLGFPPKAKSLFTWKGTEFTLNWIPFGAFVRPKGENDPDVLGGLGAAHPLKRLVVLLAGPFMNLVVGVVLFSFIFIQTGVPNEKIVIIGGVVKDSSAEAAGLAGGDVVKAANGAVIDDTTKLRSIIQANAGQVVALDILRAQQMLTLKVTPKANTTPAGEGVIGVYLTNPPMKVPWFNTLPYAVQVSNEYAKQMFITPIKLIAGQLPADQSRLTSIVGLGNLFVQARERDAEAQSSPTTNEPAVTSLTLMAIISVALGITNLLPIPALDGGRILFLLPELLVRRRIPARYENVVHLVGFAALMLLMVVIMVQDIINPVTLP
jgi:regulator of sigma E protease